MLFSYRGGTIKPNDKKIELFLLSCIDSRGREITFHAARQFGLISQVSNKPSNDHYHEYEIKGNIIGVKILAYHFNQATGRRVLERYIKFEFKESAPIIEIRPFTLSCGFFFTGRGRIVKPKALGVKARNTASAAIPKVVLETMIKVTYPKVGVRRIRTR